MARDRVRCSRVSSRRHLGRYIKEPKAIFVTVVRVWCLCPGERGEQRAPFQTLTAAIRLLDVCLNLLEELPDFHYETRDPEFLNYNESARCLRFCLLRPVLVIQDTSAFVKHTTQ